MLELKFLRAELMVRNAAAKSLSVGRKAARQRSQQIWKVLQDNPSVCCGYVLFSLVDKEADLVNKEARQHRARWGYKQGYREKKGRVKEPPAAANEVKYKVTSHEHCGKIQTNRNRLIL